MDEWFLWIVTGMVVTDSARIDRLAGKNGPFQIYKTALGIIFWIVGFCLMTGIAHD